MCWPAINMRGTATCASCVMCLPASNMRGTATCALCVHGKGRVLKNMRLWKQVAQGLGLLIGTCVGVPKTAQTIASIVVLTFVLTGGYFVRGACPAYAGHTACARSAALISCLHWV